MDPTIFSPKSNSGVPNHRPLSPSPSHSPDQRQHLTSHELDPLLANLSPSSTLEALEAIQAVGAGGNSGSSVLRESVVAASTSERALGIRAALAGKKSREWYCELQNWPWPAANSQCNAFETLAKGGQSKKEPKHEQGPLGQVLPTTEVSVDALKDEEYWGGLPARLVQAYENRIETISDDMETLELEDLKNYVRAAHGSRRSSSLYGPGGADMAIPDFNRIDDFTAIITASIMQALPTISQLNILLDAWSVRLVVLRQIPGYLACFKDTQAILMSAWKMLIDSAVTMEDAGTRITREAFTAMRTVIESQIFELGRRLDSMLDMLEGREDVVPEKWLDSMENIEAGFGTWVVETEKQVLENEFRIEQGNGEAEFDTQPHRGENAEVQIALIGPNKTAMQSEIEPVRQDLESQSEIERKIERQLSATTSFALDGVGDDENMHGPVEDEAVKLSRTTIAPQKGLGTRLSRTQIDHSPLAPECDESGFGSQDARLGLEPMLSSKATEISSQAAQNQAITSNITGTRDNERSTNPMFIEVPQIDLLDAQLPKISPFTTQPELTGNVGHQPIGEKQLLTSEPGAVPGKAISRTASNVSLDMSPDTSYPGSATSGYYSNMSSPEIQSAARAEYFGSPIEVTTPSVTYKDGMSSDDTISRQSSQRTERGDKKGSESLIPSGHVSPTTQRSRTSNFITELSINEIAGVREGYFGDRDQSSKNSRARSTSIRSTDVALKNEAHNGMMIRSGSVPSSFPGYKSLEIEGISAGRPLTSALLRLQDEESENLDTDQLNPATRFIDDRLGSAFTHRHDQNSKDSSNQQHLSDLPPPIPAKSRHRFEDVSDLGPGTIPVKMLRKHPANSSILNSSTPKSSVQPSKNVPSKSTEEQLEARISSILTEIPADIRLTSGPEVGASRVAPPGPSSYPKTPTAGSQALLLSKSRTSSPLPPMTLVPASPRLTKSRTSNGDSEVKLYHLHQVGKEAPIKLFVRLVGEHGERVMVRIGGGWADLGEYLKEYAVHHGRRSISDGRFDIQGLPESQSNSLFSTSLPGMSHSPHNTPNTGSPSPSAIKSRKSRISGVSVSSDVSTPVTPDNPTYKCQIGTISRHGSNSSSTSSRRSLRAMEEDNSPLGLAGPKTKKSDISPTKQAWVDEMLDQARNTSSAEKKSRSNEDGEFGNLGKVGSTKRVFLKSRKDE